jgi:hypothetical protein
MAASRISPGADLLLQAMLDEHCPQPCLAMCALVGRP